MAKDKNRLREQYSRQIANYNGQIANYKDYIGTANSICIYLESISKHLDAASDDLLGNVMISGKPYDRGDLADYARKFDNIRLYFSSAAAGFGTLLKNCESSRNYYQALLNSLN